MGRRRHDARADGSATRPPPRLGVAQVSWRLTNRREEGPAVHTLVDTPEAISDALADVAAPVVGVDVERTTRPRYHKPAALVQIGHADGAVLIDTQRIGAVPAVGEFLRDRSVVMHAATNDIESMDDAGMALNRLDDTLIAASLLGLPLGLDSLLVELLDVDLGADKERCQRADWELRPLPDDMAAYAAADVMHLPALMDLLAAQLDDRGRREWYRQECDHMLASTRAATKTWQDLSGVHRLDPARRAVARHLWEARERLASDIDVAPSLLVRDNDLLDLVTDEPTDAEELRRRVRRRRTDRSVAATLHEAIRQGQAATPEPLPERPSRSLDANQARDLHAAMRRARSTVAKQVGIDAGVLAPSRTLWPAVHAEPQTPEELDDALADELRPWQRALVRDALWDAVTDNGSG